MLAGWLKRERIEPGARVLDLCTGSGLLAALAAKRGASTVAIDISRRAVLSVRLNARLNGAAVEAVRGDLFSAVQGQQFDVIVSNPPYVPGADSELPRAGPSRAWEAGPRGRAFIDRICGSVGEYLKPGGVLLLVHSSVCGEGQTLRALEETGLRPEIVARRPGPLGPRLRARAGWLREQGLLPEEDYEEMLVIKAQRPPLPIDPRIRTSSR